MKFAHILSRVTGSPWFITAEALSSITDLLDARLNGSRLESPALPAAPGKDAGVAPTDAVQISHGVAVVSISGILGKRLSMMETGCGGCDYDEVVSRVATAAADSNVRSIVLMVDSRGGAATGCTEAHAALLAIRERSGKPLYAYVDTLAASAGYYLAAAADAIFCTTTAQLGCIGSMLTVTDRSAALNAAGIRRFTIKSASMKDIGNPDRAATPEEMAVLQESIDYLGGIFKRDMQAARPQIAAEVFEKGLTYFGEQARAVGLVDELLPDLATLLSQLARG